MVRSGLSDDNHLATGHAAILSRVHAGKQAKLLNDFDRGTERRLCDAHVVVVNPIQSELVADLRRAGDVDASAKTKRGVLGRLKGCR